MNKEKCLDFVVTNNLMQNARPILRGVNKERVDKSKII